MASASDTSAFGPTVTAEWLSANLPSVKVVDASWYMPNANRDRFAEFASERIPGAVYLDIDGVADTSVPLPHMLPSAEQFGAAMDALGISRSDAVVVYDGAGLFSAARGWFTFKAFGHPSAAVLAGGLPGWKAAGHGVDTAAPAVDAAAGKAAAAAPAGPPAYKAALDPSRVRSVEQMLANVGSEKDLVVDARSAGRFEATAPEPRAGLRGGHIPGSRNVPFDSLIAGGALKGPEEIRAVFSAAGAPLGAAGPPMVGSCGTGVTAAVLALAAETAGGAPMAVYDGSWTEWGGREDTPIETGPAKP